MKEPIQFDKIADIYDFYVNVDFDIPFFLKETESYHSEILELMCGTGRVSIPLLEAGRKLTCVDYSRGMLNSFQKKIKGKNYHVTLVEMDVTKLKLDRKFDFIFLPFHSISEILSTEKQREALKSISNHLETNGTFILTLQNPETRLQQADGITKIIGKFPLGNHRKMIISYMNRYNQTEKIVTGFQFYEIFDSNNILIEKRCLDINFKPIEINELENMLSDTDLEITNMYGDYSYQDFNNKTSDFIICKMTKK